MPFSRCSPSLPFPPLLSIRKDRVLDGGWPTIFVQGQPTSQNSWPNEINEDQWRVAPGPGGSLPRSRDTPGVPGSKSHTPAPRW